MKRAGDLIVKFGNKVLNNRRDAVIFVSVFAMLPFTAWLAVALVSLITLRKGKEAGLNVLLPAMVAYLVSLVTIVSLGTAITNVVITFVPAYIAAGVLRVRANWSWVFGSLMVQAFIGVILMQCFAPDAVLAQYGNFQTLLSEIPMSDQLAKTREYLSLWDKLTLAHAFFGVQLMIIALSASISLLFARFIQSKLFMPGGFKKEIAVFRSEKIAMLTLVILVLASYLKIYIAIDLLPLTFLYFLLSGMNLLSAILAQKKILGIILFVISLMINPLVMFMIGTFLGILDSLFNFRTYFFAAAKKSI